ncbi:MAG: hypothetical protein EBY22_11160 [Gammaproteobacteria bacterium]|nr:hypothetical protein [Gammaproteobacteria bacterium]
MDLDGDPIRYPLLSKKYKISRHGPLSLALTNVLAGDDGFFCSGDVMNHMKLLFQRGTSFPSHERTEVGRWDHRDLCEEKFDFPVADDMYYAWVDPDLWDYDPHCVLYTKEEFMTLFEDCCRNYVAAHPDRAEEFGAALAANGMSLKSAAII